MATYKILADEAFAIERNERFRAQQFRFGRVTVKVLCGVGLAALGIIGLWVDVFPLAAFSAGMIVLLLLGHHIDYWFLRRAVRKSPFFGRTVRLVVADEGYQEISEHGTSSYSWQAFTRALRMKDGFLVFSGPVIYWWPDSGLVEGSVEEVARVLQRVGAGLQAKSS